LTGKVLWPDSYATRWSVLGGTYRCSLLVYP